MAMCKILRSGILSGWPLRFIPSPCTTDVAVKSQNIQIPKAHEKQRQCWDSVSALYEQCHGQHPWKTSTSPNLSLNFAGLHTKSKSLGLCMKQATCLTSMLSQRFPCNLGLGNAQKTVTAFFTARTLQRKPVVQGMEIDEYLGGTLFKLGAGECSSGIQVRREKASKTRGHQNGPDTGAKLPVELTGNMWTQLKPLVHTWTRLTFPAWDFLMRLTGSNPYSSTV